MTGTCVTMRDLNELSKKGLVRAISHSILKTLRERTGEEDPELLLLIAASAVENAAYAIARSASPQQTARIILAAADLERLAERYGGDKS